MQDNDRIEQFKKMAEADPDNEMGHFSLGRAYVEAGLYSDAEPCFTRVLELNPTHSKSYELLGRAQLELSRKDEAIATLQRGHGVAAERGDVMPRDNMAKMLGELGVPVAEASGEVSTSAQTEVRGSSETGFRCSRCGRPHGKLESRPFKGALGEQVLAEVCSDCWREWIGMGTKVINEMGLSLADPKSQEVYDEHMKEFLQLSE